MSSPDPSSPAGASDAGPADGPDLAPAPRPVLTAKQSQRARQPWIAMLLSTLALLALVLVAIAMNPEPATPPRQDRVDVAEAAATVPDEGGLPALAPEVPESWTSSYARLTPLEGVSTWEVGWVVEDDVFAGLRQAAQADPTWVTLRVGSEPAAETVEVDGIAWEHHVPKESRDEHFVAEVDGSTVVLTSDGGRPVLEDLARSVAKETR